MLISALTGAVVFGVLAAAAGYVWTAFEFPFAILLPAFVGWFAVVRLHFDVRDAVKTGLVGGVTFTAAFLVAMFFALTDGSPVALTAWMAAALAAAAAGALTGWMLAKGAGAATLAAFAGGAMLVATAAAGALRAVAPAAVDTAGPAQYAYFALAIGVVGAITGAGIGAGVHRLSGER